jgi:hypothetical protein
MGGGGGPEFKSQYFKDGKKGGREGGREGGRKGKLGTCSSKVV